jgi:two-component system, OmpR family, response regulator
MSPTSGITDNRHRVVIGVDDAPEIISLLKLVLTEAGYSFLGCANGEECLKIVAVAAPRLILLDIEMPYMDGIETCRRLRALPNLSAVPIAFLTARKTQQDVRNGVQAGGNDFIMKPFQRETLLSRVQHWTSRRLA